MDRPSLTLIAGRPASADVSPNPPSPAAFQAACVEAYLASWTARGFSPVTIENDAGVLGLSCIGLVTTLDEVVEDGLGVVGNAWRGGDLLVAEADGGRSQWS